MLTQSECRHQVLQILPLLINFSFNRPGLREPLSNDFGRIPIGLINDNLCILLGFIDPALTLADLLVSLISDSGYIQIQVLCVDEGLLEFTRQVNVQELEGDQGDLVLEEFIFEACSHRGLDGASFIENLECIEFCHFISQSISGS